MPSVRHTSLVASLALVLLAQGACSGRGCGRAQPGASASRPAARRSPAHANGAEDDDGGVQIAAPVTPRDRLPGMMIPVPVRWIFLREEPVPTGHTPNMVVGALVPCGYAPALALAEGWGGTMYVRLAARWTGPGAPPATPPACPTPTPFVDYFTPERIRLGDYRVTDAASSPDAGAPVIALRVVEDNEHTPRPVARQVRACVPGRDASCAGGGVCGALPGRAGEGVCVPPLDPYLHAGRACGAGTVEVALAHEGGYPAQPAPAPGAPLRACLPGCTQGAVEAGLACAQLGAQWAWVPASEAVASAR